MSFGRKVICEADISSGRLSSNQTNGYRVHSIAFMAVEIISCEYPPRLVLHGGMRDFRLHGLETTKHFYKLKLVY